MSFPYEPGDIIIDNCEPFVKIVSSQSLFRYCNNCFGSSKCKLWVCSVCKLVGYCNKKCQDEDWQNGHKVECQSVCFRKYCHVGDNIDVKVMLFRTFALLNVKPELRWKPFRLHNGKIRCIHDMLSDRESIFRSEGMISECETMAKHINAELNHGEKVSAKYLLRLRRMQETNGFGILNERKTAWMGWGLYVEPAVFPHSCKPTALYLNIGLKVQIRAIGHIAQGEQPQISLTKSILDKGERQKLLRERYKLDCRCEKCKSASDSQVDYAKLNFLVAEMIGLHTNPSIGGDWPTVYDKHREIIEMFRQIYHEYDEHITDQFIRTLAIALNIGTDMGKLKTLVEDTRHRLATTYGKEHSSFKDFEARLKPFLGE